MMNSLDSLHIFCRFGLRETQEGEWEADPSGGCRAQIRAGDAAAHEATCGFAPVRCAFECCRMELRRNGVDAHNVAEAARHSEGERKARLDLQAASSRIAELERALRESEARASLLASMPRTIEGGQIGPWQSAADVERRRRIIHQMYVLGCDVVCSPALPARCSRTRLTNRPRSLVTFQQQRPEVAEKWVRHSCRRVPPLLTPPQQLKLPDFIHRLEDIVYRASLSKVGRSALARCFSERLLTHSYRRSTMTFPRWRRG